MSLLSRRRVIVGFEPARLSALCVEGFGRPRLLDRHAVPVRPDSGVQWEPALQALTALLAEPNWQGHDTMIILSSHYVRHLVVPPGRNLSEAERHALAAVLFDEAFGELARDWDIRVSPSPAGVATLASGVPGPLLAALRELATASRLRAIRPGLMQVFNRSRRFIGASAGYLALVESGRVTLASVESGQWRATDTRAGDGSILPHLLQEEGELHGRQPGGILWLCDMTGGARLPTGPAWSHRRIDAPRVAGMDEIPTLANWGLP